jgi:predicted  nucleic acid-binding Zn-ribbon protein
MSITASSLRQLHRIHRQRTDLRERLDRGPKQVRAAEANVKRLEEEVAQAKETLTRTKIATDDKELQLKEREARIEQFNGKLNACSTNKEYQALKERIAADEQANSVLSDEILEAFDKIELLEQRVADVVDQHEKRGAELTKLRDRVSSESVSLQSELARVEQELATAEEALPIEFKQDYKRIARARGEDALAAVDGGETCDGCNQLITPQMYDQLRCNKPVFCKTCGRLLYLPENTTVGG